MYQQQFKQQKQQQQQQQHQQQQKEQQQQQQQEYPAAARPHPAGVQPQLLSIRQLLSSTNNAAVSNKRVDIAGEEEKTEARI